MTIHRPIEAALRDDLTWDQKWATEERRLVSAWESGRRKAADDPDLAQRARAGHLIPLPWKGGVEKATKQKSRYGTFTYLAMWQGLRGEDLDVNTDMEVALTCSATGMKVTFTSDRNKYAPPNEDAA